MKEYTWVASDFWLKIEKGKICSNPLEVYHNKLKHTNSESYPFAKECETELNGEQYNPFFNLIDLSTERNFYSSMSSLKFYESLPVYLNSYLSNEDFNLYYLKYGPS